MNISHQQLLLQVIVSSNFSITETLVISFNVTPQPKANSDLCSATTFSGEYTKPAFLQQVPYWRFFARATERLKAVI